MPKALKQKQEYGIPLSRYTVFLQNCPLGHDPKDLGFFLSKYLIKSLNFAQTVELMKELCYNRLCIDKNNPSEIFYDR